jgi:hypothetical protein
MTKRLRKILACAAVMLAPAMAQTVSASHFMGGEITYQPVAPGVYVVDTKVYRDCTGATAPTSIQLKINSPGCNAGRTITVQRTGNPTIGNPYCAAITPTCTTSGLANYETVSFTTTVTFTPAELTCQNWFFSTTNNARPDINNLLNPQGDLYFEAYVNLAAGINNSSPSFDPQNAPIPFFCVGQKTSYSASVVEPDGDSVVYSMKEPLSAATVPYIYKAYPAETIYNVDSTKYVATPPGTYSASYPIHAFDVDWSLPMPLTPVKSFVLNSNSGIMDFTPTHYVPNATPAQGLNKFSLVVQVDEYRKINGMVVKIGHIRRDLLAIMVYCGANVNPSVTSTANGAPLADTSLIYLRPQVPLTLRFNTLDPNTADMVSIISNSNAALPGSNLVITGGARPSGTLTWTPGPGHVRNQPYYFSVRLKDNACPVAGTKIKTYGVKVSNTGAVTGLAKDKAENALFLAYPNPFSQEVSFKFNRNNAPQTIEIYNALGRKIDQIAVTGPAAGNQNVKWTNASTFAAGTYIARLIGASGSVQTVKFSKLQ